MDLDLTGRKALVTGSTGGIGYAIARELCDLGAEVGINGRTAERVDAALDRLKGETRSGHAFAVVGDISTAEGVAGVVRALPAVDILVDNAAIFEPTPFFDIPDTEWQRFFDTNVMSGVRLSRAYTPGMAAAGWGRVVFISSESALNVPTEMVHYGMTKTAQLAVARGLAQTVAGSGVTVNAVLPGPTMTEGIPAFLRATLNAPADADVEELGRRFVTGHRATSLIKRFARPEEVANLVAYLCSPAAGATTGAAMRVDGGILQIIG